MKAFHLKSVNEIHFKDCYQPDTIAHTFDTRRFDQGQIFKDVFGYRGHIIAYNSVLIINVELLILVTLGNLKLYESFDWFILEASSYAFYPSAFLISKLSGLSFGNMSCNGHNARMALLQAFDSAHDNTFRLLHKRHSRRQFETGLF